MGVRVSEVESFKKLVGIFADEQTVCRGIGIRLIFCVGGYFFLRRRSVFELG